MTMLPEPPTQLRYDEDSFAVASRKLVYAGQAFEFALDEGLGRQLAELLTRVARSDGPT